MMTKDELIAKLAMALIDVLEGEKPHDIVAMTGRSDQRAEEIYQLVQKCLRATDRHTGSVFVAGLIELFDEVQ